MPLFASGIAQRRGTSVMVMHRCLIYAALAASTYNNGFIIKGNTLRGDHAPIVRGTEREVTHSSLCLHENRIPNVVRHTRGTKTIEHSNCNRNCANAKRLGRFLNTRPLDVNATLFYVVRFCEFVEVQRKNSEIPQNKFRFYPRENPAICTRLYSFFSIIFDDGYKRLRSSATNSRSGMRYVCTAVVGVQTFHCDVFF